MPRNRFYFYFKWRKYLEKLRPEDGIKMVLAAMDFAEHGEVPEFFGNGSALDMAFADPFETIQRDTEQYLKTCEKNKRNISYRWNSDVPDDTTGIGRIMSLPNNTDIDLELDIDSESEKEKVFEEDIGKGVQGENLQGETLSEKSENPYRPSPADEFLARHAGDTENADLIAIYAQRIRDVQQAKTQAYFS